MKRGLAFGRDSALGEATGRPGATACRTATLESPKWPPMRAGWRPGKLPTALAPGAWAQWPIARRRRNKGYAAIYSAVELELVLPPR